MKPFAILAFLSLLPCFGTAELEDLAVKTDRHQQGSQKLAYEQDELSADVQNLRIQQTAMPVIELLEEVEYAMADATDLLETSETGGETIAAQTDVIEKIFAAAQKRAAQSKGENGSPQSGAMLDMMQRMMGGADGEASGEPQGKEASGEKAGEGSGAESDTANSGVVGETGGESGERRVPQATGKAGAGLPTEFQKALDAYNRGAVERLNRSGR